MSKQLISINEFGGNPPPRKAELGDDVALKNQTIEVVKCQETGVLMLNIDVDQLAVGDLAFIKKLGLTISNPDTDKPVALGVDFKEDTWGHRIKRYFEDDEDDDSGFFSGAATGAFLGGLSSGGFGSFGGGGGFGGFGGGGFGGGGASRGF